MRARSLSGPKGFVVLAALCGAFIALPIFSLIARVPWSGIFTSLRSDVSTSAVKLSLRTSLTSTALAVITGLPLAWVLAHRSFIGKRAIRALCVLPMVLPPVVGGIALLYAFGTKGSVGSLLDHWFHIRIGFTETAAILSQFFVAVPFFVVVMESAFLQFNEQFNGASRVLGSGPWRTMWHVTLPILRPSLLAGIVLTWARALGEFGATITFAGNTPGRTQTLPLAIYTSLESGSNDALVLSLIMIAISFTTLVLLRDKWTSALQRSGS